MTDTINQEQKKIKIRSEDALFSRKEDKFLLKVDQTNSTSRWLK